ncbi:SIS domain-containing protein [Patescibacteria group bacterium]|nr:MAG: SIS domain-containing protein [Patescibacteria group bacterium]
MRKVFYAGREGVVMLDDENVLKRRDSEDVLGSALRQHEQACLLVDIHHPHHDGRKITNIVTVGMGGSGLASLLAKTWLNDELAVPFEVVQGYQLPRYVTDSTLVIISSCSGNTEEALSILDAARERNAQIAVITGGGELLQRAEQFEIAHVVLPVQLTIQPRLLTIAQLRALTRLLNHFGIISSQAFDEIATAAAWLKDRAEAWGANVPTDKNYAKQLALLAVGKTPVFYGGELTSAAAYKWKISWNENAKNVAFYNQYPEANHNEFIGWTSHPIEKPFVVFDLISDLEDARILKRFSVSDRLLSGKRPKAITINLKGETILEQLLWAYTLADFASSYVGIMNNVDPGPVALISKLKQELSL